MPRSLTDAREQQIFTQMNWRADRFDLALSLGAAGELGRGFRVVDVRRTVRDKRPALRQTFLFFTSSLSLRYLG